MRRASKTPLKKTNNDGMGFGAYRSLGVLTRDADIFLQPWWLPADVSAAVRKLLPMLHLKKMRFYFDDYGCLRCERKNVPYGMNGFCDRCYRQVRERVSTSLKRRVDERQRSIPASALRFVDGMMNAQRLLRSSGETGKRSKR
jgi:hypothetical protein